MTRIVAYKDPKLPPELAIPEGPEWLDQLRILDAAAAANLLAALQTLCPHDDLSAIPYRRTVCHLDRFAAASESATQLLTGFARLLAEAWPLPFHELAETYRIQTLERIEATPEFFMVQRLAVRFFYDDLETWSAFGYQGASVHLGGYVTRGFDDLDWLPPLPNDI
jgi:hypothetical protein